VTAGRRSRKVLTGCSSSPEGRGSAGHGGIRRGAPRRARWRGPSRRGDLADVRVRHARWVASIADVPDGEHTAAWFAAVGEYLDDIRRGLESALASGDADTSLGIVCGLGWFWSMGGVADDCWRWLTASLALGQATTARCRDDPAKPTGGMPWPWPRPRTSSICPRPPSRAGRRIAFAAGTSAPGAGFLQRAAVTIPLTVVTANATRLTRNPARLAGNRRQLVRTPGTAG
jgi:hypothetical protein